MKKKTTILTGFLGAGKTTFLNHLITNKTDVKYAIIENEIREQNIDNDLIIRSSDDIVELKNGCLCCSLNDSLYEILSELYHRKDDFDELIIEATGITDPASIAEHFLIHPDVKKTFKLVNTICIIDAEIVEDWLDETEEARKQIAFSDVLLIGKTDLVSPSYVDTLIAILKGINPLAQMFIKSDEGEYPKIFPASQKSLYLSNKTVESEHHHHDDLCNHHHDICDQDHKYHGYKTHSHTDIVTCSFVYDKTFDMQKLHYRLMVLLNVQSKGLYRIKDIVYTDNPNEKLVVQSVGKRLSIQEIPGTTEESKTSKFVFIGRNLKPDGFLISLKQSVNTAVTVEI